MPVSPRIRFRLSRVVWVLIALSISAAVAAAPLPSAAATSLAPLKGNATPLGSPTAPSSTLDPTQATPSATPSTIETAVPSATGSAVASTTAAVSPSPTATPPSSPTPGPGGIAAYPSAPLCPDHDPRTYHALWDPVRGCHYDHHHGDDPHTVDDVFGEDYYDWAGGSISYPWQTFSAATGCTENDCKHKGYVWVVRRDLTCFSAFGNGCVVAFRGLVHAMSTAHDTSVRYHSAWLEAKVCREDAPTVCGIFRSGGWQDTGDLFIDRVPVLDYPNNFNRFKLHYLNTGNAHFGTWYSGSPGGEEARGGMWGVTLELGDMWGPLDPADPPHVQYFCADPLAKCAHNGSRYQPHVISVGFPPRFQRIVDPDRDGTANYEGFADRWGTPVTGCQAVSLNCVPLVIESVPTRYNYQGRFDYREYDILFDRQTAGWILPP